MDEYLEPYKAKDRTVPDKIFTRNKEDNAVLEAITVFGMRHVDDEEEDEAEEQHQAEGQHADARAHTEPPEGSPPTPPRSPSASALNETAATDAYIQRSKGQSNVKAKARGTQLGEGLQANAFSSTSLVSQEIVPRSTMSFPQPGQAMRSLPTPDTGNDMDSSTRAGHAEGPGAGNGDEEEDGNDCNQEAHSTQAIAHRAMDYIEAERSQADEEPLSPPRKRSPRKINDPLAFSDHLSPQASSHRASSVPPEEEAVHPGSNDPIGGDDDIEMDDEDDGLSEYERTHRALGGQGESDGDQGDSADDAEYVERQSSPAPPDSSIHVAKSQDSTQERSFSASQKSTQDRSLSRYSRPTDEGRVLVQSSDEIKPRQATDGRSPTSPSEPHGSSAQASGSSASSGALAYLNPLNVVRAVKRAVQNATPAAMVSAADDGAKKQRVTGRQVQPESHEEGAEEVETGDVETDNNDEDAGDFDNHDNDADDDHDNQADDDHDCERHGQTPKRPTQIKQDRDSPLKQRDTGGDVHMKIEEDDPTGDEAYDWPDNFPPPPSPDLPPARYRAASAQTNSPMIKREFTPAIKRERGAERIFSPVFVKAEAKAEYMTPGPAARVARKTTRGILRRKRQREEQEALAWASASDDEQSSMTGSRRDVVDEAVAAESQGEGRHEEEEMDVYVEPEPVSDPRRFDREGKRRRVSPAPAQEVHVQPGSPRSARVDRSRAPLAREGQHADHERHEQDGDMDLEDEDVEMAESDGEWVEEIQAVANGARARLLGAFEPDFRVSYGLKEDFMKGVWTTIEGLRKKAAKRLEKA